MAEERIWEVSNTPEQNAYLALLRLPHNGPRSTQAVQAAMATLRDHIAEASGKDPELVQSLAEQVTAFEASRAAPDDVVPSEPGEFVGDIFFGDPDNSTRGTHRWDGSQWVELPDERASMVELLTSARAQRDELLQIARRWSALDGGAWHVQRHASEKAELLADTRAAIAKSESA